MKRSVTEELLDTDSGTPSEVRNSLADLRRINRWFGGVRVMRKLISRVALASGGSAIRYLDVAGASGDIPAKLQSYLKAHHIALRPTVVDRSLEHRAFDHVSGGTPFVCGDALRLPFSNGSFDVVGCSLFAHHLEAPQLLEFVNEGLRVCRTAVVINDLRRSALGLALVYAGFPLFRSRITRHDAPASVRRAYTISELSAIVNESDANGFEVEKFYLFRMGLVIWKHRTAAT